MKNNNTMSFDHILITGLPVKIICTLAGYGILVIDKDTDDELKFEMLAEDDRELIQDLAFQWRDFYLDMRKIEREILKENNKKGESENV